VPDVQYVSHFGDFVNTKLIKKIKLIARNFSKSWSRLPPQLIQFEIWDWKC